MGEHLSIGSPAAVTAQERASLVRLAYRMCWSAQDAEDVVQDALLAAARHGPQLRDEQRRWPWLCRIVVQNCRLHARRARSLKRLAELGNADLVGAADRRQDLVPEELGLLMKRLLVTLPEKQRIALTLRHIEHMDYPRIAEIMRISESTARAHVRAGREHLREMILARHPEWQS
jgi:RNA polymerase sigma-70 factor (ECF subfamily)